MDNGFCSFVCAGNYWQLWGAAATGVWSHSEQWKSIPSTLQSAEVKPHLLVLVKCVTCKNLCFRTYKGFMWFIRQSWQRRNTLGSNLLITGSARTPDVPNENCKFWKNTKNNFWNYINRLKCFWLDWWRVRIPVRFPIAVWGHSPICRGNCCYCDLKIKKNPNMSTVTRTGIDGELF